MLKQKLPNPYSTHRDEMERQTVSVNSADWNFIKQLDTDHNTRPLTINILIARLVEQLKQNGIEHYNPEAYRRAVGGLTINLGGTGTLGGTVIDSNATKVSSGNVRRGTDAVAQSASKTPLVDGGLTGTHEGTIKDAKPCKRVKSGKNSK
jgi:hypothetical protein